MLREEILKSWTELKSKLQTVFLTPQEKSDYTFLRKSKTINFSHYLVKNEELDKWEREIKAEIGIIMEMDIKNETLLNYWLAFGNFSSTILNWIELRRFNELQQRELKEKEQELEDCRLSVKYCQYCQSGPTIEEID